MGDGFALFLFGGIMDQLREIKIVIDHIPPSANKYMGNSHNFNEYRNDKKVWELLVGAASRNVKPKDPLDLVIVEVIFFFPDRIRRDPDNYIKFIMDGIVRAGIIKDDSFSKVRKLILSGEVDKRRPRTEIIINEVV